jgi:uncharacterized protein involved in exopolysaccharide biosynthesis
MELYELLQAILKHKKLILLLSLSAMVQTCLVTYMLSEKYSASALVLVRPKQPMRISNLATGKELLDFPIPTTVPYEAMLQTYAEVLRSTAVAERVVRHLHLDVKTPEKSWWKRFKEWANDTASDAWTILKYGRLEAQDPFRKAVETVQDSITVTPTKDTYIFEIKYDSKNPDVAAAVVNTAAEELVQYNDEVSRADAGLNRKHVESRLVASETALDASRRDLLKFKEANRISLLDTQVAAKIDQQVDFEKALDDVKKDVASAEAEIASIRDQLAKRTAYVKATVTTDDNKLYSDLRADLARAEIDLETKLKVYAPQHPEVVAVQTKIAGIKEHMKDETPRMVTEETMSLDSLHESLTKTLSENIIRLDGLRSKEATLTAALRRVEKELAAVPQQKTQLSKLELDMGVVEETHRQIAKHYEDSLIGEAGITQTLLVSKAVPPTYPTKPIKIYYVGVALGVALVLGIGYALADLWLTTVRPFAEEARAKASSGSYL